MESLFFAIVLFAVGVRLAYVKRKRRFDRTNEFGVERFPSYWGKVRARVGDGLAGWASLVLLSAGTLIAATQFQSTWGWVVLLPVYAYMLFVLIGL